MRQEKLAGRTTSRLLFSLGVSLLSEIALGQEPPGLQIRVLSIQSLEQKPGVESAPIRVIVEDAAGRPVAGAAVAFRLPEEGPTGSFRNNLHTDVVLTAGDGTAEGGPVIWGAVPGKLALRVMAIKGAMRGTAAVEVALGGPQTTIVEEEPRPTRPLVVPQRIAEPDLDVPRYRPPSFWKSKWMVVALAAGGAIAGGYAARSFQGSPAPGAVALPPAGSIDLGPVVIGPPLVTVGKP